MATKLVWDRNAEPDMDYYRVFKDNVFQAKVLQTTAGVNPEWQLPLNASGTLHLTAVDKSGNESLISVSVPFDSTPPASPANPRLV